MAYNGTSRPAPAERRRTVVCCRQTARQFAGRAIGRPIIKTLKDRRAYTPRGGGPETRSACSEIASKKPIRLTFLFDKRLANDKTTPSRLWALSFCKIAKDAR